MELGVVLGDGAQLGAEAVEGLPLIPVLQQLQEPLLVDEEFHMLGDGPGKGTRGAERGMARGVETELRAVLDGPIALKT